MPIRNFHFSPLRLWDFHYECMVIHVALLFYVTALVHWLYTLCSPTLLRTHVQFACGNFTVSTFSHTSLGFGAAMTQRIQVIERGVHPQTNHQEVIALTSVHHSQAIEHLMKWVFHGHCTDRLPTAFSPLGRQEYRIPCSLEWLSPPGPPLLLWKSQGSNPLDYMLKCKHMGSVSCVVGTTPAVVMALSCWTTSGWPSSSLWYLSFSYCLDCFPWSLFQSNVTIRFRARTLQLACLGLTPGSATSICVLQWVLTIAS